MVFEGERRFDGDSLGRLGSVSCRGLVAGFAAERKVTIIMFNARSIARAG